MKKNIKKIKKLWHMALKADMENPCIWFQRKLYENMEYSIFSND